MRMQAMAEQDKYRKNEIAYIFYGLLIVLAILLLPHVMRMLDGNLRLSEMLGSGYSYRIDDSLVHGGRIFHANLYNVMSAALFKLIGVYSSVLLPVLLGLASAYLLYSILKRFGFDAVQRYAICLVLALSPSFLYAFSLSNQDSMAIALTLFGILLFSENKKDYTFYAAVCFALASFFSLFNIILIALFMLFYSAGKAADRPAGNEPAGKNNMMNKIFFCSVPLFVIAISKPIVLYNSLVSQSFHIQPMAAGAVSITQAFAGILNNFITDLGAVTGFGIFYLILAVTGFVSTWNEKSRYYPLYLGTLFMLFAVFYSGNEINAYANFAFAVFAGLGILRIRDMGWQSVFIKDATLLIIVCGLLFSTVSYINILGDMEPRQNEMGAFAFMRESQPDGIVLSSPSKAMMFEYFGQKPVLFDNLAGTIRNYDEKADDANALYMSGNIEEARSILKKYDIAYIAIDSGMRNGLVWDEPDKGMLALLKNSKTFKKVYDSSEIEIWKVNY